MVKGEPRNLNSRAKTPNLSTSTLMATSAPKESRRRAHGLLPVQVGFRVGLRAFMHLDAEGF